MSHLGKSYSNQRRTLYFMKEFNNLGRLRYSSSSHTLWNHGMKTADDDEYVCMYKYVNPAGYRIDTESANFSSLRQCLVIISGFSIM